MLQEFDCFINADSKIKSQCQRQCNGVFDFAIENNLRYIDSVQEFEENKSEYNKEQTENIEKTEPEEEVKKEEPAKDETPVEKTIEQDKKQDDIIENKEPQEPKTIIPEKPEDLDVEVEPSVPTSTAKVETGNDALEVDTSNIKEQPTENNKSNNDVPKVAKTNNVEYVDPQTVNGKLPQTGSYTEIYLIIAIATIMFMAFIVHSLKSVIKVDKYSL